MCDSGTNLMHLRHGPDGEPGKDPNGEQGEDQDEAAEDLNPAFPNRDRHGGDDALRLLDLHGRITKSFHPNGHFLLALHQESFGVLETRGNDPLGLPTAVPVPGRGAKRSHKTSCGGLLCTSKHSSQSCHKKNMGT